MVPPEWKLQGTGFLVCFVHSWIPGTWNHSGHKDASAEKTADKRTRSNCWVMVALLSLRAVTCKAAVLILFTDFLVWTNQEKSRYSSKLPVSKRRMSHFAVPGISVHGHNVPHWEAKNKTWAKTGPAAAGTAASLGWCAAARQTSSWETTPFVGNNVTNVPSSLFLRRVTRWGRGLRKSWLKFDRKSIWDLFYYMKILFFNKINQGKSLGLWKHRISLSSKSLLQHLEY